MDTFFKDKISKRKGNIDCVLLPSNLGIYAMHSKNLIHQGLLEAPAFIAKNTFIGTEVPCFSHPLTLDPALSDPVFWSRLAEQIHSCCERIQSHFKPENHHLYLGGDHSVAFISLLMSLKNYGLKKVGYVQFDSHGDMHLWQTSPSKNFHGMFLRAFLDEFDIPVLNALIPKKMDPSQVIFIGNLELEPEEKVFFEETPVLNIRKEDFIANKIKISNDILKFISHFEHLHVSFDVDVFHRNIFSSTTVPSQDGWEELEIFQIIQLLLQHPHCSLDIVEFNPRIALHAKDHSLALIRKLLDSFRCSRIASG